MPRYRQVQVHHRLPADLDDDLTRIADEEATSRSEVLRRAVASYADLYDAGALDEEGCLDSDVLDALVGEQGEDGGETEDEQDSEGSQDVEDTLSNLEEQLGITKHSEDEG
ncbi:MAG: CopG family transcriptional regulator [Thermoplasmata archaeon]